MTAKSEDDTLNKSEELTLEKAVYSYEAEIHQLDEENRLLRETVDHLRSELHKFKQTPLLVCEVKDLIDDKAILSMKNGNEFLVDIIQGIEPLKAGDLVLCQQKNLTIVDIVRTTKKFNVEQFVILEKPKITWKDIGGLEEESEQIREVVELPLKKPELFKRVGINPPKGVLLHGPPGTGKTLLAKAVAASTGSTFIEIVGSELVQKFIGEGAKLVKEVFEIARAKAPSVVFIDEVDALAARRIEVGTSGEREVQRTFMQLLAELDGFHPLDNVKLICATNRRDILDPAMLRPGRLDRHIEIAEPDREGVAQIFAIHTKDMMLKRFKKDDIIDKLIGLTGAEIRAICTEAGYCAIRASREKVEKQDFLDAIEKVLKNELEESKEHLAMFG